MYTYLASPYTHDDEIVRLSRFRQARRVTALFVLADIPVFSPIVHGHTLLSELEGYANLDWAFWARQCEPMLRAAHQIVVLCLPGWSTSSGVSYELDLASTLGIQVSYLFYDDYINGSANEAVTHLRSNYSHKPPTQGVRPREDAGPADEHSDSRLDAPSGSA